MSTFYHMPTLKGGPWVLTRLTVMSIINLGFLHVFQQHMSIFVGSLLDGPATHIVCLFIVHSGSFELLSAGWCRRWRPVPDSYRRQFCEPVTSECWSSSYWSTRRRIQVSYSVASGAKCRLFWQLMLKSCLKLCLFTRHRLAYFEIKDKVYTQQQLIQVAVKHYSSQVNCIIV